MNNLNNLSPDLRLELSGFLGQIIMGSLDTPEAVAQRCDRISDLAWAESEEEEEEELLVTPPSMRLE